MAGRKLLARPEIRHLISLIPALTCQIILFCYILHMICPLEGSVLDLIHSEAQLGWESLGGGALC